METAAKTGGIPGLKPIMMGLVGFPFLVRAWMGLCGQFHDIPYKDADCMLKLINETNKAHYDAHPLWPHLSYESDCDSVAYARKQAKENWHESKMMNAFVISEWALAAKWLLRDGLSFETLLFGWVAGMNTQYTMHYQHDLTQFVGNLVHHGGEGVLHARLAVAADELVATGDGGDALPVGRVLLRAQERALGEAPAPLRVAAPVPRPDARDRARRQTPRVQEREEAPRRVEARQVPQGRLRGGQGELRVAQRREVRRGLVAERLRVVRRQALERRHDGEVAARRDEAHGLAGAVAARRVAHVARAPRDLAAAGVEDLEVRARPAVAELPPEHELPVLGEHDLAVDHGVVPGRGDDGHGRLERFLCAGSALLEQRFLEDAGLGAELSGLRVEAGRLGLPAARGRREGVCRREDRQQGERTPHFS